MKKLFILLLFLTACSPPPRTEYATVQKRPVKKEVIVIDAGHGGKDSGSSSKKDDYSEKELALDTAKMVNDYLLEMGYKTVMTRHDDTYLQLFDRIGIANDHEANLFVSIHYNHSAAPSAHGIEIFYHKSEYTDRHIASKKLGDRVIDQVVQQTGAKARGVKTSNFAVVRFTTMPAILVEVGFLSNKEERAKIKDPQYRRTVAMAIARGIDSYLYE